MNSIALIPSSGCVVGYFGNNLADPRSEIGDAHEKQGFGKLRPYYDPLQSELAENATSEEHAELNRRVGCLFKYAEGIGAGTWDDCWACCIIDACECMVGARSAHKWNSSPLIASMYTAGSDEQGRR